MKRERSISIGENKAENFENFAADRTERVLVALRVLSNCGNRANYEPTEAMIDEIQERILAALDSTIDALRSGQKEERVRFSFTKKK